MSPDKNHNGKISLEMLAGPEKDRRWDEMEILLPIVYHAMIHMGREETWDGCVPEAFEKCKKGIEEIIMQSVCDAFFSGLDEVQQLCRAFSFCADEDEFPDKFKAVKGR